MLWLLFAMLAPVLWAASNLIDAHVLDSKLRNPLPLVIITGLFSIVPLLLLSALGGMAWPGLRVAALALATGAVGLIVYIPYLRALCLASADKVILMWNLAPVLVVILARTFLGEQLRGVEYLAIGLLVASSIIAVYRRGGDSNWAAFGWMIGASVLTAIESVLEKAVFQGATFTVGLFWILLATFSTALILLLSSRSARAALISLSWPTGKLILVNELLNTAAFVFMAAAISLGSVSLVRAVEGLQPVFILLLMFGSRIVFRRESFPTFVPTLEECLQGGAASLLAVLGLGLIGNLT